MDLRQLTYFLTIAKEGQITKAAKHLHITQPPLSQQMLSLEKELGVQLFRRTKKSIILTEAGTILQRRASQILDLVQLTTNEVRETSTGLKGKLTIGIINSSGRLLLPEVIRRFHKEYPQVTFDLHQGTTLHIIELLKSHLIDVGFVRVPIDTSAFESVPIPAEKIIMVAHQALINPPDKILDLMHLKDYPLLVHRRYESTIMDYFHNKNVEPTILCTSDEMIPLLTWALRGLGIAIVPEFSITLFANPELIIRELKQPSATGTSALIWRKNESLPATASHFIELFQTQLRTH